MLAKANFMNYIFHSNIYTMINMCVFKKRELHAQRWRLFEGRGLWSHDRNKTNFYFLCRTLCSRSEQSLLIEIFRDTNPKNAKGKEVREEEEV